MHDDLRLSPIPLPALNDIVPTLRIESPSIQGPEPTMSAITDSWIRRHRISVDEYYRRNIKVPLYAEHAIVEVWLIDLSARQLHRFSHPSGSGYGTSTSFQGGSIEPAAMPGVQIDLGQFLQL